MKSKDISKTKNKSLSLSDTELNTIIDRIVDGETMFELAKDLQIKLTTLYKYLDQNPKTKERIR
jgi:chromatin remodeling complex protein RSC6